jgi:hypothetical protein
MRNTQQMSLVGLFLRIIKMSMFEDYRKGLSILKQYLDDPESPSVDHVEGYSYVTIQKAVCPEDYHSLHSLNWKHLFGDDNIWMHPVKK